MRSWMDNCRWMVRSLPRRKAAQNCKILPWLSARSDCEEGRFLQLGNSLLLSHVEKETGKETNPFVKLSPGAKILYLSMCMESGGHRSFRFPQTAAKKYGLPPSSFWRYVQELIREGMIKKNSGKNTREPNDYEFCFDWKRPP